GADVGLCCLLVLPARTYLHQRQDLDAASERAKVLSGENKSLTDRAAKLHDNAEIERLAREQYGLVKPGEEAYAILPSPPPPTTVPPTAAKSSARAAPKCWTARFIYCTL